MLHFVFFFLSFQVPIYAVAQLTGSISASFTLSLLLHPIKHVGTTSPSGSELQAVVTEIIVTFSMMFITSAVATDTKAVNCALTRSHTIIFTLILSAMHELIPILIVSISMLTTDRRASRYSSWVCSMHNIHLCWVSNHLPIFYFFCFERQSLPINST